MTNIKYGLLIKNNYITSTKFVEQYQMFLEAASQAGCTLECMSNTEAYLSLLTAPRQGKLFQADFVIFWDKDVLLAKLLEKHKIKIFNSAAAIEKCDDKGLTYIELLAHDLRMPKTFLSPKIYHAIETEDFAYFQKSAEILGFPLVIKENRGSFGYQVHLAADMTALFKLVNEMGTKPFLMQEFIQSSVGRDIRIQVVGDQVVASVIRTNPNDFRANVTNGGTMKSYQPQTAEIDLALQACHVLGLDFAGVDLLFGEHGEPVLCEVNSNAQLVNLFHCTKIDGALKILEHIRDVIDSK